MSSNLFPILTFMVESADFIFLILALVKKIRFYMKESSALELGANLLFLK